MPLAIPTQILCLATQSKFGALSPGIRILNQKKITIVYMW